MEPEPFLQVTWADEQTGATGHLVIDRLLRGAASGGLRMRPGCTVEEVADRDGVLAHPAGLDVERLLAGRSDSGIMDRGALADGDILLPSEEWLSVESDVLVTAAASYAVHGGNHEQVRSRYLVEGANVSVLPEAEAALAARGVIVVPDFAANFAANSWWWTLFGDIGPEAGQAFAKIERAMRDVTCEIFDKVRSTGVTPRVAGTGISRQKLALALSHQEESSSSR